MAQKKSYSRYFIILQEDEKGYSLASDKIASGYAKLETKNDKCKISYYVQNLKKEKTPYYMMLICNKKGIKNIIKIGEMNIDDYGRADTFYEYPINDVAGSGIAMDKVSGAAIVRILDNNIIPVMSGFSSTEIPNWRSFELIEDKDDKDDKTKDYVEQDENKINEDEVEVNEDEIVEKAAENNEKSIFDKYEESIEKAKRDREKTEIEKDNEEDKQLSEEIQNNQDEEDNQKSKKTFADEKEEPISEDMFESKIREDLQEENITLKKELGEEDSLYIDNFAENHCEKLKANDNKCEDRGMNRNYQRNSQGNFFNRLVYGFKEIKSLNKELKRCKWYKVPANSIEDMYNMDNYSRYALVYYPMIGYYPYIKKHFHYLTGYKFDKNNKVKYLIYGIPGTNSKKDQPYGGKSGFVTWIPKEGKDKMGYWLMFYDFKTNTIVIPVKK
ncbi:hypothetical protein [Clostridium kluyveri]|uniref:DUF7922 domain-containing protein n=1 Tax=Clostridium kluyveri TaxID=1534 RepID=A0A1L5FDH3_CLOKL|nr:hypothetical protein [Clostridium kluyveri]APM41062.1 hypothetical protein BS101_21320 [Clostridium kluyveri]UZQ48659.1 hypothetical protein OP486_11725 [Clostridium kluyveri]